MDQRNAFSPPRRGEEREDAAEGIGAATERGKDRRKGKKKAESSKFGWQRAKN